MSGELLNSLLAGDRRALGKAITRLESSRAADQGVAQELLQGALNHSGNSVRVGITGSPGVGKSTFIEAFGLHLIEQGHRVAVLAVDPSSPVAGGSILGDKTRMADLSRNAAAFIRPSPAGRTLGGVARKTRESVVLCEAAGYDIVLVETVGVGQSEYQVASMVDFFLVLMLPSAGDELQGLKKGIMELAHALVINKADGDGVQLARQTQGQYASAVHLFNNDSAWTPPVLTCSALEQRGIDAVWQTVDEFVSASRADGRFKERREQQNQAFFTELTYRLFDVLLEQREDLQRLRARLEQDVMAGRISPYHAAQQLIETVRTDHNVL